MNLLYVEQEKNTSDVLDVVVRESRGKGGETLLGILPKETSFIEVLVQKEGEARFSFFWGDLRLKELSPELVKSVLQQTVHAHGGGVITDVYALKLVRG